MEIVLYTVITLSLLGIVLAVILFVVAQKFKVIEDPRIDEVESVLPGANCGGCGYPGCRGFAEVCVNADSLEGLFCPAGGNDCMKDVASTLGMAAVEKEPQVAVIRCSGTSNHRAKTSEYDGPLSCAMSSALFSGDTDCPYGCLGLGDCVTVCTFDAIYIDEITKLPVVNEDKCTACGACLKACPKNIIELRNIGKKSRRIYVSCINKDKGPVAKKACAVACIGCKACVKACAFDAVVVENFLAYIDYEKCKLCRKCVDVCPTGSILELNFPPRKVPVEKKEETKSSVKEEKELSSDKKDVVEVKTTTQSNNE